MPETRVSRDFLHRCCVQLSSPLDEDAAVEAETKHALRFARAHAAEHPSEIARALIWRIVDTDDANDHDRAGAWTVMNGVLAECGEADSALSRTALADKISLFLPFLISHRWFTLMVRQDGHDSGLSTADAAHHDTSTAAGTREADDEVSHARDSEGDADVGGGGGPSRVAGGGTRFSLNAFEKVIPSSTINDNDRRPIDRQTAFVLKRKYKKVVETWEKIWRADVFREYKRLMADVARYGNHLSPDAARHLDIPATFRDSLWRLRRKSPRPSLAMHVLLAYGWDPTPTKVAIESEDNKEGISTAARPRTRRLPRAVAEVEALDGAMHPGVRKWLQQLIDARGGCRLCDTWQHVEERCPCEVAFQRALVVVAEEEEGQEGGGAVLRSGADKEGRRTNALPRRAPRWHGAHQLPTAGGRRYTYMEAVDRLYRSGIALPLRDEDVLDHIVTLILRERPYEEVLAAFDTVRGAVTGPEELHALWLHASYSLLPSRTAFDKPNDESLSPALIKAERFLKSRRRLREWDQMLRCVEVLDTSFRRRRLPDRAEHFLSEIRETSSFFLCLVDGSLPASYTPGRYARVPEEVVGAARLKDILCHSCLRPFHCIEQCPHKPDGAAEAEPWDLQVARLVLSECDLLDLRSSEDNRYRIDDAMRRIDEDDRKAKDFRKMELRLALKIMVDRNVPYCADCRVAGHSTKSCEARARRVFAREGLRELDVKLNPKSLFSRLRQLRRDEREAEAEELRDAFGVLAAASRGYPQSFIAAIRELDDAHIPLAAARYSTDAVQSFLLYINSGDLLTHLRPLRAADFPEVCLFCDSYHHLSEECQDAKADEQGFLRELRRAGVNLWQYLRSPTYYDSRLPSDYPQGRASVLQLVRQFDSEYGPGGIARQKFVEHNGLGGVVGLSQMAGVVSAAPSRPSTQQPLQTPLASYPNGDISADANAVHGLMAGAMPSQHGMGTASGGGGAVGPLYGRSFSQLLEPTQQQLGEAAGVPGDGQAGGGGVGGHARDRHDAVAHAALSLPQPPPAVEEVLGDSQFAAREEEEDDDLRTPASAASGVPYAGHKRTHEARERENGSGARPPVDEVGVPVVKAARTESGYGSEESSGGPAASSADGVLA